MKGFGKEKKNRWGKKETSPLVIHFDDKHANPNLSIHVLGRRRETVRIRRYVHRHWGGREEGNFMNETNNVVGCVYFW